MSSWSDGTCLTYKNPKNSLQFSDVFFPTSFLSSAFKRHFDYEKYLRIQFDIYDYVQFPFFVKKKLMFYL